MLVQINQITPSKEALGGYITDIVNNVENGIDNTVEIAAKLDFVMKICEGAKKQIIPWAVIELQKAKDRKDYFGYKIEVCEAGTKYDYSNCGDVLLYDLQKELDELTEKVKNRQNFIKALKEPIMVLHNETGELFKVCPPIKTSTTTAKFSLK